MRIHYSSRLFLYLPFVVLLALAGAASLRWWQLSSNLEQQLRAANCGQEIAPGVTMHFVSESLNGFPFNLDVVLNDFTLKIEATRGPIVWHADRFAMHALTYGRAQEIFEAAEAQTLSWSTADGETHRLAFEPGSLHASAIWLGGRLARFDLDINGLGGRDIEGERVQLHLRQAPAQDAIDIAASANALQLSPALQAGFGVDIHNFVFAAQLRPAAGFARLLSGGDEWRNATETWRRDDGSLRISQLDVQAGKMRITAKGKLSLDDVHRASGMLDMTIANTREISQRGEGVSPIALALFRLSKDEPSPTLLHVFLNLRNGAATAARVEAPDTALPAGQIGRLY